MDERFQRALKKWPNVPALFGWLSLDRRGRWRIQGELISKPLIIDTIGRNYAADEYGRWYFQNGPQRGYIHLESAPLILRTDGEDRLTTHNGLRIEKPSRAFLDEQGAVWLDCEHGPAVLEGEDLQWALNRLRSGNAAVDEASLGDALDLPSGSKTTLSLQLGEDAFLPVLRLDAAQAPRLLGFVRDPQARPGEAAQNKGD